MGFIKTTCPSCGKAIEVPDDAAVPRCMYCGQEVRAVAPTAEHVSQEGAQVSTGEAPGKPVASAGTPINATPPGAGIGTVQAGPEPPPPNKPGGASPALMIAAAVTVLVLVAGGVGAYLAGKSSEKDAAAAKAAKLEHAKTNPHPLPSVAKPSTPTVKSVRRPSLYGPDPLLAAQDPTQNAKTHLAPMPIR